MPDIKGLEPLSLYLHIPFCRHRCAYCDFNTYTSLSDLKDAYVDALCREMAQVAGKAQRPAQTVFLGGGTPSLLSPGQLERILIQVAGCFALEPGAEITLEANPDTVDLNYLNSLRGLGFNRISFGAQSADPAELAMLEREHDFETVVRAAEMSRAAGLTNFNLDLIYGLPGQSATSWRATLDAALTLAPPHLSLYCLIVEPGTPMQRWLANGLLPEPDPDVAAEQYDLACDLLAACGYQHYELSNWCLPSHAGRHNLAYWRNGEYLGFGAGAHGHAAGRRYSVVRQPRRYIGRLEAAGAAEYPLSSAVADAYLLTGAQAMADTVITQLRLLEEGLDLAAFADRFGRSLRQVYPSTVERLIDIGLLEERAGRLRLTRRAWFLSNQVFVEFV